MKERLPILCAAAIALPIMLAFLVPGCGSSDPQFQGKSATMWVAALEDPNPEVQGTAKEWLASEAVKNQKVANALIHGVKLGNFAAAELMGELAHDVPPVMAPDMVQVLAETVRNKGSNISVRLAAAKALPKFGVAAGPAVPALIDMLRDDTNYTLRERAAESIGGLPRNLAQQATQALLTAAKTDSTPAVQFKAVEVLRVVNPEALKQAGGN